MKHVQLLGMTYTQSYSNPITVTVPGPLMEMLESLITLKKTSLVITHLCWNLDDTLEMCLNWKRSLDVDSDENREYVDYWKNLYKKKPNYRFPKRLMELWVTTKAMVFSELFPRLPVHEGNRPLVQNAEKILFVMSMQEMHRMRPYQSLFRCVGEYIQHYCPWRVKHQFIRYINDNNHAFLEYSKTGNGPDIKPETMAYKSYDEVVLPSERPKETLSYAWNSYVFSKERVS